MEPRTVLKPIVTAFSANKGGVGKTRQALLTANCLGAAGKRVLVIDMDFNNSATFYYLPDDQAGAAREKNIADALTKESNRLVDYILPTTRPGVDLLASSRYLADLRSINEKRLSRMIGGLAGLSEVPVEEKEFAGLEDAKRYAYRRQAERRNLTPGEILAAAMKLRPKETRDGTGRVTELLAKSMGVSPSTVKHAQVIAREGPDEIIDEVKHNRMTINHAYQLTKGKAEKPAKAKPGRDRETSGPEDEGLSGSNETEPSAAHQRETAKSPLERLDVWVHRENLNIPGGNDARFEAARSMLQTLEGFVMPNEFIQDLHTLLQALFQEKLDRGIRGAGHEE